MKDSNFTIDYVIVGAGIIGLQMAYELLRKGVSPAEIAIFEQNIFPDQVSLMPLSGSIHSGVFSVAFLKP